MDKTAPWQVQGIGAPYGLDEPLIKQIGANLPVFLKAIEEFKAQQAKAGIDPEKLSKESVDYQRAIVTLTNTLENFRDVVVQDLLPAITQFVGYLDNIAHFATRLHNSPVSKQWRSPDGPKSGWQIIREHLWGRPESGETATAADGKSGIAPAPAPGSVEHGVKGVMDFFHKAGLSWEAAAGVAANLKRENSKLDPDLAVVDSNGQISRGLAQWNEGSPERYAQFKSLYGHDLAKGTFEEQLGFIMYEMSRGQDRQAGLPVID